ncbi:MAG: alpha/beta hydrolase [bacterium]|nr:alpha/beta hydrolase [bacterium]
MQEINRKESIVILHGWGASRKSWEQVARSLEERGFKVFVPDLPGFGSAPPPESVWGLEEYISFLKKAVREQGLERFVLAGHSFGGQLALGFALAHPREVEKLVLVAPAAIRRKPGLAKNILKLAAKIGGAFFFLLPFESLRTNARKAFYRLVGRRDYLKATGVMRNVMAKVISQDLSPRFGELAIPTLLVWGDKDALVPLQDAETMKDAIPHAELKVFAGVGHNPHFDRPQELAESIASFAS